MKSATTKDPEHVQDDGQDIGGNTSGHNRDAIYHLHDRILWRQRYWRADKTYVCTFQDASWKPLNAWEWLCIRWNHALAHQLP